MLAGGGGDYGKRREGEEEGKKAQQGLRSPPHRLLLEVVYFCAIADRTAQEAVYIPLHHRLSVNRGSAAEPRRGDGYRIGEAEAGTWTAESDCLTL